MEDIVFLCCNQIISHIFLLVNIFFQIFFKYFWRRYFARIFCLFRKHLHKPMPTMPILLPARPFNSCFYKRITVHCLLL